MDFHMPLYRPPSFADEKFISAPDVKTARCATDGVLPDNYHSTSIYPEYFKVNGEWKLAEESRMDCSVILRGSGVLDVVEMRNVKAGDSVILGRDEDCGDGIYLNANGFIDEADTNGGQFVFRQKRSRETAFSCDYDRLYALLEYEKAHGNIVWVMGPAFAFDHDARKAMQLLTENGYVNGLLAGNALAVHDLEAGYLRTALGQDIYTQRSVPNGHYNHLDTINAVRRSGSIASFIQENNITSGIIYSLSRQGIPFVLTGSIRDDGPLPEVCPNAYDGQDAMRRVIRKATTVICLATQLHTIAAGNMAPCFRVVNGAVRPLYIYSIDISEFATNKLADRGSLTAIGMVTNVQDFIVNVAKGVGVMK